MVSGIHKNSRIYRCLDLVLMHIRNVENHSMKQKEECVLWDFGSRAGERMRAELSDLNKVVNVLLHFLQF